MEQNLIDTYIEKATWRIKENSNQIFCVGHLMNFLSGSIIHDYWLKNVMTQKIKEFHDAGKIHLHDLSRLTPYCSGFSTNEIITKGLKGPKGRINSLPPKHFGSAINQLTNFVGVMSQEFAGAIALNDFSLYLAPFVYYDKLDYKQVKQEIQQFIFHMNQPNRWAGECPFTNITINLAVPEDMKDIPVFVGKTRDKFYGDFDKEMNMINEAILEVLIEGDANGTPLTFPVLTIGINGNFPWESEIAKKVFQVTAKYGTPFFENFGKDTGRDPSDTRSMCCFTGNTKINCKIDNKFRNLTLRDAYIKDKEIEVLQFGKWVKANPIMIDYDRPFYEITLRNGFKYTVTDDHIHVTDNGDVKTTNLSIGDSLKFSHESFEYDGSGSYDLGKYIGYYLAEGSSMGKDIQFSIGETETNIADFITDISNNYFGATTSICKNKGKSLTVSPNSHAIKIFIDTIVQGKATTKHLINWSRFNKKTLQGIWDGWFEGDGSGSEVYTSSKYLAHQMKEIARILEIKVNIRENENEEITAFGELYIRDMYTLHVCKEKTEGGKIYNNGFVKITDIKKVGNSNKKAFCVEILNDEPYFELADGLYTHNCRLSLSTKDIVKHTGGLFGNADSTGSIAVATINLNRIGYEAKSEEEYYTKIEEAMIVCKDALELRRAKINEMYDKNLYVYTKFYLKNYRNYFSTIGIIGGNESMLNFMNKNISQPEARDFMLNVLSFMRGKCEEFSKETKNLYNLEAVPGEGAMYSLAKKDKEAYKDIIVSGKDEIYLTGSTLPPVEQEDFVEMIHNQEDLQVSYTGGCVEKGTNILTNKGIMKIEEIQDLFENEPNTNLKTISYNEKEKKSEWCKIKNAVKIDVSKKDKIRVIGEKKLNIVTSDWHPFLVLSKNKNLCPICNTKFNNGKQLAVHMKNNANCRLKYSKYTDLEKMLIKEKRADELKRNDYILQSSENLLPNNSELNSELAWVLGYFIGDGGSYIAQNPRLKKGKMIYEIKFYDESEECLKETQRIINKYFDTNVNYIGQEKNSKCKYTGWSIERVYKFFEKYGLTIKNKCYNVKLSEYLKQHISKENIMTFLAGLIDSDGYIDKQKDIIYSSVSSSLINDLLEITTIAGLNTYQNKSKRKDGIDYYLHFKWKSLKENNIKLINTFRKERLDKKTKNLRKTSHYPISRVKTINKIDVDDEIFYDLEVEKNHNYLAGNNTFVFIHNTALNIYIGEKLDNYIQARAIVKKIAENTKIPYFSITPTYSICKEHGYISGESYRCPECNKVCEVFSRVVGYLKPVQRYNLGKREEYKRRKKYEISNLSELSKT